MLHKSFKPAKCKTSLRLATSRIKLMKNKKGVQINQMNKELAQLLQNGQDRTARIRVEHVIREEKMVAAYELIEIYCELIVARLPIIESQKTCPIDLKEAVTSVIFAAPRCADISELADIKKQFTAKYGKDFVSAALELRPDCGVSRMLVEKLSAVAPDVQTKVKVLSAVAKEHNIEWDATSFEEKESKPPNDLLNGPANLEKASMANADPPKVQPSNANVVHSHEENRNTPVDYSEQNRKYTVATQNVAPDSDTETSSAGTHADIRSSGITSERMEMRQPDPRDENEFSSGRENWNMEFKDATDAAQAAAESAERAAMAARAAAQFSNQEKIAKQHPTGSHVPNIRGETPHVSATSGSIGEGHSRDSYERSSNDRKPKLSSQRIDRSQHDMPQKATERFDSESSSDDRKPKILSQHVDGTEHDTSYKATERYGGNASSSGPTSVRSNIDPIEDEKLLNDVHMTDGYFEESKTELGGSHKESFEYENINYFAEEATKNQPSIHSSHYRSSTSSYELDAAGHQKAGKKSVVGNPFAVVDQGSPFREATYTSSNIDFPRHDISDDEAISDDDGGPKFDTGFEYDGVEDNHSLENTHIWSPRRNKSTTVDPQTPQSHLFTESVSFDDHSVKSVGPSEIDDHEPASFDHSDDPDSDTESGSAKFDPEPVSVESSQNINSRKTRFELNDLVESESSFSNPKNEEKRQQSQQPSSRLLEEHELKKHNLEQDLYETLEDSNNSFNQSDDLDNKKELNFGTLTGGLRNKGGFKYPPYNKSASDTSYLSKKASKSEDKKPSSDSDSDDPSDSFAVQSFEKASKPAIARPQFSPPAAFVNADETNSEEEASKHVPSRVRLGSGLSRRTRGPPSAPHAKSHVDSEPKRVIPSQYSYADEVPVEPGSYARRFIDDAKQIPESQKQTYSPSKETAETSSTKSTTFKPRVNQAVETEPEPKIPTRERIPTRIVVESGKTETARKQNLGSEKLPGENIVKKQTHVHPKLPDYDSLAAHLQSLRTDKQ